VNELQDVILVGSRGGARVKTESPVPVDVIKLSEVGFNTARMDITSTLNFVAPSFNYNKQSGADGADHIDIGTLRGLGPDQTLVLINGKRRHSTAFVGLIKSIFENKAKYEIPSAMATHLKRVRGKVLFMVFLLIFLIQLIDL
jgi:outer membrane receptor for ferrienterochelin and colicin